MAGDEDAAKNIHGMFSEWEREETARRQQSERLKDFFKAAKGNGWNAKALRVAFAEHYAKDHFPAEKLQKRAVDSGDADLYLAALSTPFAGVHTRGATGHDADGVFHDDETIEPQPETAVQMQTGRNQSKASPDRAESIVDGRSISVANTLGDAGFIDPIGWEAETNSQLTPSVATGEHVPPLTVLSRPTGSNVTPLRAPKPIRPNCMNREKCGASGPSECWSCTKAATRQGGAA